MKDTTTATIRTAVPTAWATVLVWLIARLGWSPTDADWQVIMLAMPAVVGIVYRLGRIIEVRWPLVGHILFGSGKTPSYAPER